MEKYARQALSEGIKNAEDIHVSIDSELYRVLNLHYNRNNHIEVSLLNTVHSTLVYTFPSLSLSYIKLSLSVTTLLSLGSTQVQMGGGTDS